ncbi:receptor expression-enhancing protein 1/2/3/4 [Dioscorea alata]|uniref:Receptor expression-enhancing protein 1/2/3/4 n=1 Tax=Dioscorea alata TaxID=55571 RepID=A0ACB7UVL3_DIOAL|nr:receptor expression-enhancing protein 1/2/3/4 [Dioscorea alata]
MMGSFLTRALVMALGYAYPAYECYKTVELNKPEIEQLRFWCQYWILVAVLTVFERVGDAFVSWLPMYSEAKLAFFVYLWYPKTKGTTYVYNTFFRPYVAKHETEIDRNLLELRTRAGDIVVLYWQKAASYGQTRFFDILQYVAAQSQSPPSRPRPVQRQPPLQTHQAQPPAQQQAATVSRQALPAQQQAATTNRQAPSTGMPNQQQAVPQATQQPMRGVPASPAKGKQQQDGARVGGPLQTSSSLVTSPPSSENADSLAQTEVGAKQVEDVNGTASEGTSPPPQEMLIEEAIRVTRGRLRKRAATVGPAGR